LLLIWKEYAKGLPANPKMWQPKHVQIVWDNISHLQLATQLKYLTVLLLYLRFCGAACQDVKLNITPTRTRVDWISMEQVSLLLSTAPNMSIYAMEVLMTYTGMRREEISKLRRGDLQDQTVSIKGKRRKGRNVPLTPEFWQAFQPYLVWRQANKIRDDRVIVFYDPRTPSVSPHPYSLNGITQAVVLHGKMVGFHVSPHTLRRTFGRNLWKAGCPLELIREILGHSSVDTTIQYLGINQFDIQEATRFFPHYAQKLYLKPGSQQ
jgi:integrase